MKISLYLIIFSLTIMAGNRSLLAHSSQAFPLEKSHHSSDEFSSTGSEVLPSETFMTIISKKISPQNDHLSYETMAKTFQDDYSYQGRWPKSMKTNEMGTIYDHIYIKETDRATWDFIQPYDTPQASFSQGPTIETRENNLLKISQEVIISPKIPGELLLPSRKITIFHEDGTNTVIEIPAENKILVESVLTPALTEEVAKSPIIEAQSITFIPLRYIIAWVIGALLLIVTSILSYFFIKQQLELSRLRQQPKPIAADFEALQALINLEQHLDGVHDFSPYCLKINFIIRRYLAHQFHLAIFESTTEETIKLLSQISFLSNYLPTIQNHLEKDDFIKFAKGSTDRAVIDQGILFCKDLIEKVNQNLSPISNQAREGEH